MQIWLPFEWLDFVREQTVQWPWCFLMYVLFYWAYIVVCCAKKFLLMSDSQKAFLYHTVANNNITGSWFHSTASSYVLDVIKGVYTRVTVRIPHGVVMLALSIQNFYLWFWLLSKAYCMNVMFQRLIAQNKLFSKQDAFRTKCIFLCVIVISNCNILLYTVQSNHDLYIYTLYFLSKPITMRCEF